MKIDQQPFGYFDTSVLVKRYVREDASDRALALMRRHGVVSTAIAPLEIISAVRRRQIAGMLHPRAPGTILKRLHADRRKWDLVAISSDILTLAEQYVENHNVRSLDAIHLATAYLARTRLSGRLPFITADSTQRDVAVRLLFEVIWVG